MRVLIVTLGTRGDFELFAALGRELRSRGHDVVLGAAPFHEEAALAGGLGWVPIGAGDRGTMLALMRSLESETDRAQRTRRFASSWLGPQLQSGRARMAEAARHCEYFICNLKLAMARDGAVIPGAFVTYDPPHAAGDLARFGSRRHGGRILELIALNRTLVDPQHVWDAEYRFTGFWHVRPAVAVPPSPDLEAFAERDAPVALTMGSMTMFDADRLVTTFAEALRIVGRRGVVVGGWSGMGAGAPADIKAVGEVDYDWLFPRAACVIHHGGAGTVAAVLRSGRPSVLLPQISAQEDFARLLLRERLASAALDVHDLTPQRLAAAIGAACETGAQHAAAVWRDRVREDGGLALAGDLVEAHALRFAAGAAA
jgi:sterol 3beta-glucosyltransferase